MKKCNLKCMTYLVLGLIEKVDVAGLLVSQLVRVARGIGFV